MTETVSQPMQALEVANRKRAARVALKRRVASGETPASTVIRLAPEILVTNSSERKSVTAAQVIGWQKGWGPYRAEKLLRDNGFEEGVKLESLSTSRRKRLAELVDSV